jgi:hypothetical protein
VNKKMQPKALWIYEKQSQFCYTEMQQEILKVNQVAFVGLVQHMYGVAIERCKLCRTDSWSLHRSFDFSIYNGPQLRSGTHYLCLNPAIS